jgi:hypothetical protein
MLPQDCRDAIVRGVSVKLHTVYARFYKSFNFDHLRKARQGITPKPWEYLGDLWYPYVETAIEPTITTVVGANESGKSHLLSAIEKAITGEGFEQRDLCRYSPVFNVEQGVRHWPNLGVAWKDLTLEETAAIRAELKAEEDDFTHFLMFRTGPSALTVYIPGTDEHFSDYTLSGTQADQFGASVLPKPFRILPNVALPSTVPLAWLADPEVDYDVYGRRERSRFLEGASIAKSQWRADANQFAQIAPSFFSSLNDYFSPLPPRPQSAEDRASLTLARKLLVDIAKIDPEKLRELGKAIGDGEDGHANALMDRINEQLSRHLNFPKWWVQDRDFSLRVTSRELDLVFTIQDRTGTEYTFSERSSGLKYFLSYLIQSRSHEPPPDHSEILLMDEPDTYLSAEAQQDLLKIFDAFAQPQSTDRPVQVVYVTHSPFLIDKNHAERVRVLEKGKGFDGTRVIRNAAQNHYEPLRTAFGAYVGETAFIGACNLLVEGITDQIVLSGIARLLRSDPAVPLGSSLDLNRVVIVPCGSASHAPYMLYLIRGRDTEKPPVIALLDSDQEGNDAVALMRGKDAKLARLIRKEFVFQLGELGLLADDATRVTLEDLLPPSVAVQAANRCLREISRFRDEPAVVIAAEDLPPPGKDGPRVFDRLNAALKPKGAHLDKVGFARAVVEHCEAGLGKGDEGIEQFFDRMKRLFLALNAARRRAEQDASRETVGSLVARQAALFVRDYGEQATRETAATFLDQVLDGLDESIESDAVRMNVSALRRDFELDDDPRELVRDFEKFSERALALKDAFHIDQIVIDDPA